MTVIIGALVAVGVVLCGVVVKDVLALSKIQTSIRDQQEITQRIREEKAKLRDDIERTGSRIREMPDSLGKDHNVVLMKESQNFAKIEGQLDDKTERTKRVLRHLEKERDGVAGHLQRWGVRLAGIELVLVGLLFVVRRMGS